MALAPASSAGVLLTAANTWTANQTAPAWIASGLTGAVAASRYVGATASGAPVSGTFVVGDFVLDQTGKVWVCTVAGSPGTWIGVGGSEWTTVTKLANESIASNQTLQDDDELFFTAASGSMYAFEAIIIYASPAGAGTPDIQLAFGEDATDRGQWAAQIRGTGTDAATTGNAITINTTPQGSGTAAAKRGAYCIGTHLGNAGVFRFRWAQNSSNVSATIVYAGSYLRYRVVA